MLAVDEDNDGRERETVSAITVCAPIQIDRLNMMSRLVGGSALQCNQVGFVATLSLES